MFDDQDRQYFAQRAAACRKLAADAVDANIKKIHSDMADEYERRARGEAPRRVARLN